jgi:DNA-binding transcriptional ArsR family regulator
MTQTYRDREKVRPDLEELLDPDLFKALSDPNRVALLAQLCRQQGPSTVTEAAECCPVDVSVVSRHLATLRQAGVLDAQKQGRQVHYSVPHSALASTLRSIADALEACCSSGDGCDPTSTGPEEHEEDSHA